MGGAILTESVRHDAAESYYHLNFTHAYLKAMAKNIILRAWIRERKSTMEQAMCPHCGQMTVHRVVRQRHHRNLLWCQKCFRVSVENFPFAVGVDPLEVRVHFRVNFHSLDTDHERLVEVLNDIHAIAKSGGGTTLAATCAKLLGDTARHFRDEEALLTEHAFPLLAEHREHHQAMLAEMRDVVARLDGATPAEVQESVLALKFCLVELLAEDMKYKNFLPVPRGVAAVSGGPAPTHYMG